MKVLPVLSTPRNTSPRQSVFDVIKKNAAYVSDKFPHISNKTILAALDELSQVYFDYYDVSYITSLGVDLQFRSGKEAVDFLADSKLDIKFAPLKNKGIFGYYNNNEKAIIINQSYHNVQKKSDLLAITETIIHEAGHAKDNDDRSSIQEELNNLSLNVLTHRFFKKKYPTVFENSNSLIVNDGIEKYEQLFFDPDPSKNGLVTRLREKYGFLPMYDFKHLPYALAQKIKQC